MIAAVHWAFLGEILSYTIHVVVLIAMSSYSVVWTKTHNKRITNVGLRHVRTCADHMHHACEHSMDKRNELRSNLQHTNVTIYSFRPNCYDILVILIGLRGLISINFISV